MTARHGKHFRSIAASSLAIALCWGAAGRAWADDACKTQARACNKDAQCCAGLICKAGKCAAGCRAGGVVYAPGDSDGNCQQCAPNISTRSLSDAPDGTSCIGTDDDFCTVPPFACKDGACVGQPRDCSTLQACKVAACDSTKGACVLTEVTCPASTDQCYRIACDPLFDFCVQSCAFPPACNDGNPGPCGDVPGCDSDDECIDNDPCTDDFCDRSVSLCSFIPRNCNDNDLCTIDFCQAGHCSVTTQACGRDADCPLQTCVSGRCSVDTDQACQVNSDCATKNEPCLNLVARCSVTDSQTCAVAADCPLQACGVNGRCSVDTGQACQTNSDCPHEPCNLVCRYQAAPAALCNDGVACTTDSCANNACVNVPASCDDSDPCTVESCSLTAGDCVYESACNDGNLCTTDLCSVKKSGAISCQHVSNNCTGF